MSSNNSKSQSSSINQPQSKKNSDKNSPNQIQSKNSSSKLVDLSNPKKNFLEQTEINEKYFPQKSNYFASENNEKIKNNLHSPIIDYFSPTSTNYLQKYNSPEEIIDANKNNKNSNSNKLNNNKSNEQNFKMSPKLAYNYEQNFDFSPSNIFNNFNNNNFIQGASPTNPINNIIIQNNQNNEEGNSKTLQERIGLLVGKNDGGIIINKKNNVNPLSNIGFMNTNFMNNDLMNNNYSNINNNYYINTNTTQTNEEEEENQENQEEAYLLNLNIDDEKDLDEEIQNNNNNQNQNNNINNNQNSLNNNKNYDNNYLNENMNRNEADKGQNLGKKFLIKKDMSKPFIPNRFRNNGQQLNNIILNDENKLPSYEGNKNNNNLNMNNIKPNTIIAPPSLNNNNNNYGKIRQINTTNNIFYPIMNNNFIYTPINYGLLPFSYPNNDPYMKNYNQNRNQFYPQKIGEYMNLPIRANNIFNNHENNKFTNYNKMNNWNNNNNTQFMNHFYYNGDQYQISEGYKNFKKNTNNDANANTNMEYLKNSTNNYDNKYNTHQDISNFNNKNKNNFYTITSKDFVTTITSNNKKIKRVNPKTYLNESYEYLAHNIFILSKDQAGCRFLQEKLEKEPQIATKYFYEAILQYILPLVKDPFGNYLIQKLCKTLDDKKIKKILEISFLLQY